MHLILALAGMDSLRRNLSHAVVQTVLKAPLVYCAYTPLKVRIILQALLCENSTTSL